ncbi:hypothetical protein ACXJJ3_04575 [Kribbella sp. WER1]
MARQLDPTSDEYRLVAGLIRSAHRMVGATDNSWWNNRVGVLPRLSRTRSQVDLDGTLSLHPRYVAALRRNGADDVQASRDASYEVVRGALRLVGEAEVTPTPGRTLDQALPANQRDLDQALTAQRASEITERAMAENAMPYSGAPFEATTHTAAVRGLGDRLGEACGVPRDEALDQLIRSPKHSRWVTAIAMVAEAEDPGLLEAMEANDEDLDLSVENRDAGRQWARLGADRAVMSPGADAAAYQIGRDTGGLLTTAGKAAAEVGAEALEESTELEDPEDLEELEGSAEPEGLKGFPGVEGSAGTGSGVREPSPAEVLGAQAPPGTASGSGVTAAATTHHAERGDKHLGL